MTPKRIRSLAVLATIILASATTTVLSHPLIRGDVTKCHDYVCTGTCEGSVWVHGVCIDGSRYYQISAECCCCVPGAGNRKLYGG